MVFVATYWTRESPLRVRVFGNVEAVELFLNGRSLGRQRPDTDRISNELRHPPFSFQVPAFEAGTLEAVGFIGNRAVTRHRVRTPGEPERVEITFDDQGVCSQPGDLLFARARLADAQGTTVPASGRAVQFTAQDGLSLIGPAAADTEAGVASVLVRTGASSDGAKVIAASGKLIGSATFAAPARCR